MFHLVLLNNILACGFKGHDFGYITWVLPTKQSVESSVSRLKLDDWHSNCGWLCIRNALLKHCNQKNGKINLDQNRGHAPLR